MHCCNLRSLFTAALSGMLAVSLSGCLSGAQDPDPNVDDFPIAYVKRTLPVDDEGLPQQPDLRDALAFNAGGDLYIRDRASPSAAERNITGSVTGGLGDVRDVEVSYDGTKLIFALHMPELENVDPEDQPKWNIWEYEIPSGRLTRVIASDTTAEAGHDVAPHYLPDGRIVFSSTRQRQIGATLLDEGKPQFAGLTEDRDQEALVLHVMNADGSDIRQISFNQSHDLDPTVLSSGKIVFSRWDNAGNNNAVSLYKMAPDGTELELLYGAHSHDTGSNPQVAVQFVQPREMQNGQLLALLRPFTGTFGGGTLVTIDVDNYVDINQPTSANQGILSGPGQTAAVVNDVRTEPGLSPGGRFSSAYPLWDGSNRLLVSWSPCRVVTGGMIGPCTEAALADPNAQEAAPLYGLFIYDMNDDSQLPVALPEENVIFTDIVAAQPRPTPTVIFDKTPGVELNATFAENGVGALHIRSVYDVDGVDTATPDLATVADPGQTPAANRPARFLRIVKAVPLPEDVPGTAFGRSAANGMREIIGYAPIEPDGSVFVQVPANVPLAISVLDSNGRRTSNRHLNWIQVLPGEVLECNGCHDHSTGLPHGTAGDPPAVNRGAPTSGIPFTNASTLLMPEIGETMAETRARIACLTTCDDVEPTVDIIFQDIWTDPNVRTPDTAFSYAYNDLTTPAPTSGACITNWNSLCRVVINYETHIHPLWSKDRRVFDQNMVEIDDYTCTNCHAPVDDQNAAQVPAAQLDLTDGASDQEPDHFKSYRELLFPDTLQELNNGTLVDVFVTQTDADGNPIQVPVPAPGPYMSANGANASEFFDIFAPGADHDGYLSAAELKLLSEWLDIGAQYYNNPFDVPQN